MGRGRRAKPARRMKPVFYVYCEGKTEEAYVSYIKQQCRIPIQIRSKVSGTKMSPHYLRQQLKPEIIGDNDRIFLIYDLDDPIVAATLDKCESASIRGVECSLLSSNPCFELWLLLHAQDQRAHIESKQVVKALEKHFPAYKKGTLQDSEKSFLEQNLPTAIARAKQLPSKQNPSTDMYRFHEEIERAKV
jgi:hypothetical protein